MFKPTHTARVSLPPMVNTFFKETNSETLIYANSSFVTRDMCDLNDKEIGVLEIHPVNSKYQWKSIDFSWSKHWLTDIKPITKHEQKPKRLIPKQGDVILVKNRFNPNWHAARFDHLFDGKIFTRGITLDQEIREQDAWRPYDPPEVKKVVSEWRVVPAASLGVDANEFKLVESSMRIEKLEHALKVYLQAGCKDARRKASVIAKDALEWLK